MYSALVVTYKPNGILHEMVMGLDVTAEGGGSSLCKSISGAKSTNTLDVVMRVGCCQRLGEETVEGQ